jgi:hypothetical protein
MCVFTPAAGLPENVKCCLSDAAAAAAAYNPIALSHCRKETNCLNNLHSASLSNTTVHTSCRAAQLAGTATPQHIATVALGRRGLAVLLLYVEPYTAVYRVKQLCSLKQNTKKNSPSTGQVFLKVI